MKKILLVPLALALATPAWAARQEITDITTQQSRQNLREALNLRLDAVDDNTIELYTDKADKAQAVRYWADHADGTTLAVNTLVAYNGKVYNTTQEFLKTSGATPVGFGAYFSEVGKYTLPVATTEVLGGVKQGDRVTIAADGTISADVQTTDISGKQDTLTAGDNITITGTTISATVPDGTGDDLGDATALDVAALFTAGGDYLKTDGSTGTPAGTTYTAGTGITITEGVIASTVVDTDTFADWDKDYGDLINKPTIPDISGKEDSLGNPSTTGYVLSSTTAGVRSWIEMTGGGTGIAHATSDGSYYASRNGGWADLTPQFSSAVPWWIDKPVGTSMPSAGLAWYNGQLWKAKTTHTKTSENYPQTPSDDWEVAYASPTGSAAAMTFDASGFTGNLATTDNTVQELADAVDDLVVTGGSGTPGGSSTQVQFNDGGAFGGDAGLTYNKTTDALTVGGALTAASFQTTAADGNIYAEAPNTVAMTATPTMGRLAFSTIDNYWHKANGTNWGDYLLESGMIGSIVQGYDADLATAAGADAASVSTYFGKNAGGAVGFHALPTGTVGTDPVFTTVTADEFLTNAADGEIAQIIPSNTTAYTVPSGKSGFVTESNQLKMFENGGSKYQVANTSQAQNLSNKSLIGASYPTGGSATQATGDINIDGLSADYYTFSNTADATYAPVATSRPSSGIRTVILEVGGGTGAITMNWANVDWIGNAGAPLIAANTIARYACLVPSSGDIECKVIYEDGSTPVDEILIQKEIGWTVVDSDVATAVADGKQAAVVPASMNGMNLIDVTCSVADLNSAASGATTVVLRRVRGATAADMTSTGVTVEFGEYSASDEVIDTSSDDVATGDKIYVDINAVTTAAHKGLGCTAVFQAP